MTWNLTKILGYDWCHQHLVRLKQILRFLAQNFSLMTQLGYLHNIIFRSAYWLHVLAFHICLYEFPFFCKSQSFFRWSSFSKWHFTWLFRLRKSRKSTLVDLQISSFLILWVSRTVRATLRRVYDTYVTNKWFLLGNVRKIIKGFT